MCVCVCADTAFQIDGHICKSSIAQQKCECSVQNLFRAEFVEAVPELVEMCLSSEFVGTTNLGIDHARGQRSDVRGPCTDHAAIRRAGRDKQDKQKSRDRDWWSLTTTDLSAPSASKGGS